MDPPVDDGAGAPPDPWAEAARATRAHVRGDDPADDQEDSGNRSRRAWRRAPHSEANALGDPADGGNVDDDEPEYDATLHGWQDYDPTKHAWNPRWSRWTGWESSWDPMWNYDWSGKLWSGTPSTTSGDGQQWDGKWHDADKSDPWDSERRTSSGLSSGWNQEWNKDAKLNAISGAEWRRRSWASEAADRGSDFSGDRRGGLSERMTVPSFSANNNGDELGQSARSYLRQIEAWVRITRAPSSQQALLLYQNLQGRAWVEAEELDVKELCQDGGVERFKAWISERYLEIEVGKIAEALNGFFNRMKRGSTQSVREFNASFDRAYARLVEIDCKLPETAKAWAYLSSLSLTHSEELAILGSVNYEFICNRLQRAAVLHEKNLRRPWDGRDKTKPWERGDKNTSRVNSANAAEAVQGDSDGDGDLRDDPQTELEVDLYEAFITAKAQYKEAVKHRNLEPDEVKPQCPGPPGNPKNTAAKPQTANITNEVFETSGVVSEHLLAITDSACTKSVAGTTWLQKYVDVLKSFQIELPLLPEVDNFKFGASRVYASNYAVVVSFQVGGTWILVKVSIIHGDLPLLLSRTVLAELGMVYNIKEHVADFATVNVCGHPLLFTPTGHPAISVHPGGKGIPPHARPDKWEPDQSSRGEVQILSDATAYIACCSSGRGGIQEVCVANNAVPCSVDQREARYPQIFYAKRIPLEVKNLLVSENIHVDTFIKWWIQTSIMSDFWVETPSTLVRVHVIPRKSLFSPKEWNHSGDYLLQLTSGRATTRRTVISVCGSAAQCSIVDRLPQFDNFLSPLGMSSRAPWQMTKTELLSEANRLGLAPSARWTVEELKSAIVEAKKDLNEDSTVPKGMSGMKLAELKAEADRIGVMYASGVTRGTLMRHIRDYHETPDNTVMNIGRYRGSAYFQVPLSYAQWADQEERANGINMSPDLKRFVLWFRRKKAKEATGNGPTRAEMMQEPEKYAKVPYPGGWETSQSWENVTVMNEVDKQQRPFIPESSGAKNMASSSTSGKRTAERPNTKERMSVEPDPNMLDEIRALEQRLALLKDDYNPDLRDIAAYQESKPEDPTENVDYKNNVENEHIENHSDYQRDDYNLSDVTGEDELSFDDYDAEVLLTECTEDAIHNAIKSNDYTPQRLLHLLQDVFGKDGEHFPRRGAKKRTRAFGAGDLGENHIVLGYYTYGSMRGICNNSSKYAFLSIYIKNYFLSKSADAK
ncbi:hypothetical protein AK812_SmicGene31431 [Symbiodinium microadriaticum]|uniref:Uncharacterized protein n=1 Tax=Symbiodinium microadriaticum TaxID=2951 RepID=A0A1Q9CWQ0_SYMMI|nr:hypothetical protein AK812_SmicGene31431 [Symbiodinium microadriaticum]